MFRIETSPDRPMFVRGARPPEGHGRELVACVGDTIAELDLLCAIPHRRVRVEPDAATAISLCLENRAAGLLIDIAPLGAASLSALGQLRLLRPDLPILLLTEEEGAARLEGTLLDGLPVLSLPRELPPLDSLRVPRV